MKKRTKKLHPHDKCFLKDQQELIPTSNPPDTKKDSNIHKWFSYPNHLLHPELADYRLCNVCHERGKNTLISAVNASTSGLRHHLYTHAEQWEAYLEADRSLKAKTNPPLPFKKKPMLSTQQEAVSAMTKWIVNSLLPVTLPEDKNFREFMEVVAPDVPGVSRHAIKKCVAELHGILRET